jgi:hypothetical protein
MNINSHDSFHSGLNFMWWKLVADLPHSKSYVDEGGKRE